MYFAFLIYKATPSSPRVKESTKGESFTVLCRLKHDTLSITAFKTHFIFFISLKSGVEKSAHLILSNHQIKGSRNSFLFVESARRHIKMEESS